MGTQARGASNVCDKMAVKKTHYRYIVKEMAAATAPTVWSTVEMGGGKVVAGTGDTTVKVGTCRGCAWNVWRVRVWEVGI